MNKGTPINMIRYSISVIFNYLLFLVVVDTCKFLCEGEYYQHSSGYALSEITEYIQGIINYTIYTHLIYIIYSQGHDKQEH